MVPAPLHWAFSPSTTPLRSGDFSGENMTKNKIPFWTRVSELPFMLFFAVGGVIGYAIGPFVVGVTTGIQLVKDDWASKRCLSTVSTIRDDKRSSPP